jgi:parallel beta-helix repeat protein
MTWRSNLRTPVVLFIVLMALAVDSAHGKTIHVKVGGTGNGSSWATAYGSLQDALDDAEPNDNIWVAEGTYKPTKLFDPYDLRSATFQMKNNVEIYGGFPATAEPSLDDRDPNTCETVLSGDLSGNDVEPAEPKDLSGDPCRAENSWHVLLGARGTLDGFSITGGNANGGWEYECGGGYYGSGNIVNCTFSSNYGSRGGAIYGNNSTIDNCIFKENAASIGGGIALFGNTPTITNCSFTNNWAYIGGSAVQGYNSDYTINDCRFEDNSGATIYNDIGEPTVDNCIFRGNNGTAIHNEDARPSILNCMFINNDGRGICNYSVWCEPKITNCIFTGNGGGIHNQLSGGTVTNCTFSGNKALSYGGGLYYEMAPFGPYPKTTNCIFWGNTAPSGPQIYAVGPAQVTYSNIQGGYPGIDNIDNDPCFANPGYWDSNGTPVDVNDDFFVPGDYHLKSQAGRYDPSTQIWIYDDVSSLCIDAGNPGCPEANEPSPNGSRINMGAYGGTAEASKSPEYWRSIADMTNDWIVDSNDLKVFVDYWLETGECIPSDFDRSQFVDFNDFAIFGGQWGQEGPGPGIK